MTDSPVVIVGGGVAGLAVAKNLIECGLTCTIVERAPSLGGHVRNWACMATDECQRCFCCLVEDLARDVGESETAKVMTGWELSSIMPSQGQGLELYLKELQTGAEVPTRASALVLATGFEPYNAAGKVLLGHGRLQGVFTLAEVDALLRQDSVSSFTRGQDGLKVAFFQCVGSRDAVQGANYCSQYCCKAALRMALKLVHECPDISVTVFYIDLQVAGKYSGQLLRKAERNNIRLCQGVPGEIVEGPEQSLEIIVEYQGVNTRESYDRVILSIGQRPASTDSFGPGKSAVPVNEFGFIEPKGALDSSRMSLPGMYVAGTCTGPKDIEQTIEHAGQTAQAILADLRAGRV